MPHYQSIDENTPEGQRTADRLRLLRKKLREVVPVSKRDSNVLVATWNLREFGKVPRLREALFYIAEIISRFDVVAVQEIRSDMGDLRELMKILGDWWKYILTDVTEGRRGNDERLAFVYNTRKVDFGGYASNVVPDPARKPVRFSRTPFEVGFYAGWFRFQICTTHAYYGADKPDVPQRRTELRQLAQFLAKRAEDGGGQRAWARHTILLGDFNVFDFGKEKRDKSTQDILISGFRYPEKLAEQTAGFGKLARHYDQIAFYTASKMYGGRLGKADMGTFDFFESVFRDDEGELYGKWKNDAAWRRWRTYQMSDHRPLWIEFATDYSDAYLWAKSKGRKFATRSDASEGVTTVASPTVEVLSRTSVGSNRDVVDGGR